MTREKDYSVLDKCEWNVAHVESDDYGDTAYKWHVEYRLGGRPIYDDYFMDEPDDVQCYNTLLESYKNGATELWKG